MPRSLVKLHFADDVRREVAEHLIPDVYRQALTEARIDPVNEPDLQDVKLEEDAPLSFVAVVEVKPAIALSEYTGLERPARARGRSPTTDVDETLEQHARAAGGVPQRRPRRRHRRSRRRRLHAGPEGHEPTTADRLRTSSSAAAACCRRSTPAAVGMQAGEEREVALRFADDHRMETLRGKGGTAALKVSEVKEKVLPALDDDFAKSLGRVRDARRAPRRGAHAARGAARRRSERRALEDKVVEAAARASRVRACPTRWSCGRSPTRSSTRASGMRRQGVDPERVQWDYDKLIGELRPGAEQAVRRALLLEAIAEQGEPRRRPTPTSTPRSRRSRRRASARRPPSGV